MRPELVFLSRTALRLRNAPVPPSIVDIGDSDNGHHLDVYHHHLAIWHGDRIWYRRVMVGDVPELVFDLDDPTMATGAALFSRLGAGWGFGNSHATFRSVFAGPLASEGLVPSFMPPRLADHFVGRWIVAPTLGQYGPGLVGAGPPIGMGESLAEAVCRAVVAAKAWPEVSP